MINYQCNSKLKFVDNFKITIWYFKFLLLPNHKISKPESLLWIFSPLSPRLPFPLRLSLDSLCDKTIIEWFRSRYTLKNILRKFAISTERPAARLIFQIFAKYLSMYTSKSFNNYCILRNRRPRGWYCKFSQIISQCILRNHSIIIILYNILNMTLFSTIWRIIYCPYYLLLFIFIEGSRCNVTELSDLNEFVFYEFMFICIAYISSCCLFRLFYKVIGSKQTTPDDFVPGLSKFQVERRLWNFEGTTTSSTSSRITFTWTGRRLIRIWCGSR